MPLRARPRTATGRPPKLSQVEVRQVEGRRVGQGPVEGHRRHRSLSTVARKRTTPEHRGQHADDPEAEGDLLLVPAAQLEVMVQRCHAQDAAAAGQLVVAHLHDVRARLGHEDDADERQDEDLAGDEGGHGQGRPQGKRRRRRP